MSTSGSNAREKGNRVLVTKCRLHTEKMCSSTEGEKEDGSAILEPTVIRNNVYCDGFTHFKCFQLIVVAYPVFQGGKLVA